jgi:hypothetical protein
MRNSLRAPPRIARLRAASLAILGVLLICGAAGPWAWGQDIGRKSASNASGNAFGSAQGTKGLGFSIESEMLTYRALESNSAAVGCDIASFLSGNESGDQPVRCEPRGEGRRESVVIVPFDSAALDDFQLWRAEMDIMRGLSDRAAASECGAARGGTSRGLESDRGLAQKGAKAAASAAVPGGSMVLSLAQGLLGMIPGASSTPVVGTIEDQAFMDGIGRELRRWNIRVFMPSSYAPYLLSHPSAASPFLSRLNNLLGERACLISRTGETSATSDKGDTSEQRNLEELVGEIDAYVGALRGFTVLAFGPADTRSSGDGAGRGRAPANTSDDSKVNVGVAPVASSSPPALLLAVLAGEGFAHALGADDQDALDIDNLSPHVLFVKALESGGTVASTGGLFHSKTLYSGGSVGTFALFDLKGDLECSGNVYEYHGAVASESFEQDMRNFDPNPSKQYIIQRGTCQQPHER